MSKTRNMASCPHPVLSPSFTTLLPRPAWSTLVIPVTPRSQHLRIHEIRMHNRLLGRDPGRRVVHEQCLKQIQPLLSQNSDSITTNNLLVHLPLPLGKAGLEVWQRRDARPLVLARRAEDAEDLEDLVDFAVAWEERLLGGHLGEDAADGPHVDAGGVLSAAEQDLGRTVPERDDFVGVGAERDAKGTRESEVSQFEVARAVDEKILGLEITMEDAVGVAVANAGEELMSELLDLDNR